MLSHWKVINMNNGLLKLPPKQSSLLGAILSSCFAASCDHQKRWHRQPLKEMIVLRCPSLSVAIFLFSSIYLSATKPKEWSKCRCAVGAHYGLFVIISWWIMTAFIWNILCHKKKNESFQVEGLEKRTASTNTYTHWLAWHMDSRLWPVCYFYHKQQASNKKGWWLVW